LICRVFKFGENEWDFDLFNDLEQAKTLKNEPEAANKSPQKSKKAIHSERDCLKVASVKGQNANRCRKRLERSFVLRFDTCDNL
jgi:hypothetical protein